MHLGYLVGMTGLAMNRPMCQPIRPDEAASLNDGLDSGMRFAETYRAAMVKMIEDEWRNDPIGLLFDPFGIFKPIRIACGLAKTSRSGEN